MGVLLNGARVGEPVIDVDADGQPVFWNALYNGVQVWPPAAETVVDVWLKPVDFTAQALYADHPEVKVAAQKVFADGHIEDASLTFSTADTTVASIKAGTVSFVSDSSNFPHRAQAGCVQPVSRVDWRRRQDVGCQADPRPARPARYGSGRQPVVPHRETA